MFYLELGDFKGAIADVKSAVVYNWFEHFGVGLGVESFRLNVEDEGRDYPNITFVGSFGFEYLGAKLCGKMYFRPVSEHLRRAAMPYKKSKRRKKIRKKDIKLFLVMCAIAAAVGILLTLFYGSSDKAWNRVTESILQEYQHRTGKNVDPATRRQIESVVDSATGKDKP